MACFRVRFVFIKVIALYCIAHPYDLLRPQRALVQGVILVSYEAKLTREKKSHLLLNKHGDLSFFPHIFDLPFILFLFNELEKNACLKTKLLLETRYSWR